MRMRLIFVIFSLVAAGALADEAPPVAEQRVVRRGALVIGDGSSIPGTGLSAERYVAQGQFSVVGGVGYILPSRDGRGASGFGIAGGLRAYTSGRVHRGFAEMSFSPVAVEVAPEGSRLSGKAFSYGPGVSLGYSLVKPRGLTFWLCAGVGRAVTGPSYVHGTEPLLTIAFGRTWVRH